MSCLSSCSLVDCFCVKSLQGWDKDKFSGLNSSDERHLRLLSDAVLEQRFLLQLVCHCGLNVLQMLSCRVCPLVHWLIVFVWRVCKDETKINSAGWIPVTRDISAYFLMQFWNSVFFCSLFVTAVWMSCKCFHVVFVSCSLVDCFCVKSLQGWDKDKFSGLNSSDERHLRLLSDAVLEQRFLLQLVCHCGLNVLQMLSCRVCPLVHWLIVFVWRVCKDETKINSAGWIPVTRDISAYFLMQFWNSVFFCKLVCHCGLNVLQMLSCHVCPLVHWLTVFVWRVCKDETKINSAGWIPVTRDISAYFLMQFWNSVFFCSLFVTAVWKSCRLASAFMSCLSSCSLVDCSLWRVCKDETKINSAGWIPVTRDISAYFLMQFWNSVFFCSLFLL